MFGRKKSRPVPDAPKDEWDTAIEQIEKGWTKGTLDNHKGSVCALGAIGVAAVHNPNGVYDRPNHSQTSQMVKDLAAVIKAEGKAGPNPIESAFDALFEDYPSSGFHQLNSDRSVVYHFNDRRTTRRKHVIQMMRKAQAVARARAAEAQAKATDVQQSIKSYRTWP